MKDGLGDVQSVLVLGGTSDIGLAIARRLAGPRQAAVVLAGRDRAALEAVAEGLRDGGGAGAPRQVATLDFDALETAGHDEVLLEASRLVGDLDVVVVAFGLLGDQEADEAGGDGAVRMASVNYVGAMSVGLAAARRLRSQGHGTIVMLSSVAGERVRKANFIYGSSKAGMDGFAQGLGRCPAGVGCQGADRTARFRRHQDDSRHEAAAAVDHAGSGCRRHRPGPPAGPGDRLGARPVALGDAGHPPPAPADLPAAQDLTGAESTDEPQRPRERQGVAAFDFDGTMIRGDSFMPFLVQAVGPRKFGQIVIRSSASTAQAYRLGRRDASKAVLVRRLLAGYPADRLAELGQRYSVLLAQRVRPFMNERVAWHQGQGHRLVIVSASLEVYLRPTGRALGFDQVIATQLEVDADGLLTGRLRGANVRGAEKSSPAAELAGPGLGWRAVPALGLR